MDKIKICFIQTGVYQFFNKKSKNIYGGSELQLYLIAKEISKDKKFLITFIVGNFNQDKVEKFDNVVLYKSFIPKTNDNLIIKFFQAIQYYKLLKKINADIYFTSAANATVGLVSFFCKYFKKKHVHRTAHMMDVDKSFIKSNGILGKIYKYGLESSDVIISQCNDHKKLLKKNHNINSLVFKNSFKLNNNINIKKRFILWVARFEKWKRPELFLKLTEFFPEEIFIMICNKQEKNKKEWEEIREKGSKIKNIKFFERIPINKIQDFFNESKIFVNTSYYEGFPNTFIQAGLARTPILSLSVNPDNFINKFECGFYCKNNFNEMKKKMSLLLNNKKKWKEKSNNVFKYVKENHDIDKNIVILKNIINSLIDISKFNFN